MAILDTFFNVVHIVFQTIRDLLSKATPEYYDLVILVLACVGGYYLFNKYPLINKWGLIALYAGIIFLSVRFI
jgi:hypothetical protein